MKSFIVALIVLCLASVAVACPPVAVVQSFAVAQPVYVQQAFAVQAVPVYQQQFVQAQAFAVQPYYMQQNVAFAQAGGFARAQAQAIGGFGGSSLAISRVGRPAPVRNGLAIIAAAAAARRSSSVSIAISR